MYAITKDKKLKNKTKFSSLQSLEELNYFLMPSKQNGFKIAGETVKEIRIYLPEFAHSTVSKYVANKYNKLIANVTELLTDNDGDDDGESFRHALNEIERFRQEIKNKYRMFLEKKELMIMSKQLGLLKTEALKELNELQNNLYFTNTQGKNR